MLKASADRPYEPEEQLVDMLMLARNKHIPSYRIFVTFLLHDRASIGWRDRVCKLWIPHVVSAMLVIIDREDILNKQDGAQRGCDGCLNDIQGLLLVKFNDDFCCSVSDDLALPLRNLRIFLLGVFCHNGRLHLGWHAECDRRIECLQLVTMAMESQRTILRARTDGRRLEKMAQYGYNFIER